MYLQSESESIVHANVRGILGHERGTWCEKGHVVSAIDRGSINNSQTQLHRTNRTNEHRTNPTSDSKVQVSSPHCGKGQCRKDNDLTTGL
jgi:hypothetical protein